MYIQIIALIIETFVEKIAMKEYNVSDLLDMFVTSYETIRE